MGLPKAKKILTAQIPEKIYYSFLYDQLFPENKGCHEKTKRTCDLIYIDQHIPK